MSSEWSRMNPLRYFSPKDFQEGFLDDSGPALEIYNLRV